MGKHWAKSVDAEMQIPSKTIELKSDGLRNAYHLTPCASMEYKSGTSVRQPYGLKMYAELIQREVTCEKSADFVKNLGRLAISILIPTQEKMVLAAKGMIAGNAILNFTEYILHKIKKELISKEGNHTAAIRKCTISVLYVKGTVLKLASMKTCLLDKITSAKYATFMSVSLVVDLISTIVTRQRKFADYFALDAIAELVY